MTTAARDDAERHEAVKRRYPIGTELVAAGLIHSRVWAPRRGTVTLVVEGGGEHPLQPEGDGYFSAAISGLGPGTLYRFRLDGDGPYPDPASRFQPDGPHGPSMIVDPLAYRWRDQTWPGVCLRGQVLYEMHIGTFTGEGTWRAAAAQLPALKETGITVLEVMPVADFPGRFGWGYDGVNLFAPTRLYGTPDDLRAFVDAAHGLGLAVILDVVYNHLGPDGNYLTCYAEDYFSSRYRNEWGDPINFDGDRSAPVREFFIANARYWIDEFHLDGLRLDATQQIFDASPVHVLTEIQRAVRRAARGRATVIVAENEPQNVRMLRPESAGGHGLDALWNDDLHHSAMVALTGRNEAYYGDHLGRPQEFVSAAKYGTLFQGQWYSWQKQPRGTPLRGMGPERLVAFLQNHDQIANSGRGLRLHRLTAPGRWRAVTALLLLLPATPMLFQGQEFAASQPFLYFADHPGPLGKAVARGRAEFLSQFPSLAGEDFRGCLHDPGDPGTFAACKLDHGERGRHAEAHALHRDLLALRRNDPVFAAQRPAAVDGAVLDTEAFALRFFGESGDDRLLLVNLGRDLPGEPAPEPLLAPPEGRRWRLLWSSECPRYGGSGTPLPPAPERPWRLPGHCALVLAPAEQPDAPEDQP